jgi:hypothetical protein
MHDDDLMDDLLKDAMAAPEPQLSPDFDGQVMRAVAPRRLDSAGRTAMFAYALVAVATTVWMMKDLRPEWIAAALVATLPIVAGTHAYVKRLLAR